MSDIADRAEAEILRRLEERDRLEALTAELLAALKDLVAAKTKLTMLRARAAIKKAEAQQ